MQNFRTIKIPESVNDITRKAETLFSLPPRAPLPPKTPFSFPFKRLPRRLVYLSHRLEKERFSHIDMTDCILTGFMKKMQCNALNIKTVAKQVWF